MWPVVFTLYPMHGRDQRATVWFISHIMPVVMNDGQYESYFLSSMFNLHEDKKVQPLKHHGKDTQLSSYRWI